MDFLADFTAIDFETANRRPDSACQLGVVTVRDGRIVDQASWLIRPNPCFFNDSHIRIHGITPEHVKDVPTFGESWTEIAPWLTDQCLVAHNASFDMNVLLSSLRTHEQSIPEFQFTCTRAVARRVWPHRKRYGLKPLSEWLGIRFRHHDALEDSIACAKILLAAGIDREAKSLDELEQQLKMTRGSAGSWGYRGPTARSRRRRSPSTGARAQNGHGLVGNQSRPSPTVSHWHPDRPNRDTESESESSFDFQRLMIRAEFIQPLAGTHLVISGRLKMLTPDQAEALATKLGATCQHQIGVDTHMLVVASDQEREDEQARTTQPLRVVTEQEFVNLVSN